MDSAYVHNSMVSWVDRWLWNGWQASTEGTVTNFRFFKELHERICEFEQNGMPVQFWLVERAQNDDADRLANQAY